MNKKKGIKVEGLKRNGKKKEERGPFLKIREEEKFSPLGCSSLAEGTRGLRSCLNGSVPVLKSLSGPSFFHPILGGSTPRGDKFECPGTGGSTPHTVHDRGRAFACGSLHGDTRFRGLAGRSEPELGDLRLVQESHFPIPVDDALEAGQSGRGSDGKVLQDPGDSFGCSEESSHSCRDRSLCHRAPLSASVSASPSSSVVWSWGTCIWSGSFCTLGWSGVCIVSMLWS